VKKSTQRPIAFVLSSTDHGSMLVNRNDYYMHKGIGFGVGYQLFHNSSFEPTEVDAALQLLQTRRQNFGDGVIALDCGANIGVHTIEWARFMHGWGVVVALEAQERIFYALAGNIALNNCFNARAIWAAVGAKNGSIQVPVPNYLVPSSYGSLELRKNDHNEFIGQEIDYSDEKTLKTQMLSIDGLALARLDFIKIDIEGMEMEALSGAQNSLKRLKPQLLIEKFKTDETQLKTFLEKLGYKTFALDINLLAVHESDPALSTVKIG